ncbi:MAG TPA: helix-turn-helix domain-containing protein, partial [Candidatus Hypogeohydataceae bacterium YC38]
LHNIMKNIHREIGKRIKIIRGNLSQKKFGELLGGISQDKISKYESGTIAAPISVIATIAKIGNVTVDWIFFGEEDKKVKSLNDLLIKVKQIYKKGDEKRIHLLNQLLDEFIRS